MPFKHFLKTSLDFERTHQLILQCLFNDPLFLKVATGVGGSDYRVILEPVRGLFDIGIYDTAGNAICLIELKMWSNLSGPQLERQWKYLESQQCPGVHILLGTSDLQFHRDDEYDEISEISFAHSCKVGYKELIQILARFVQLSPAGEAITIIADNYKNELQKQADHLYNAWLDESSNLHIRCYSTYQKIRKYLLDESFYIYTVNNAGGNSHILNDDNSWTDFTYKGHAFRIYQEILDLKLMIRIESFGASYDVKTALKWHVIKLLQERDPYQLPWSFSSHTSKYHKVAIYNPPFKTEEDCQKAADIMKSLNPLIKGIVGSIKDEIANPIISLAASD